MFSLKCLRKHVASRLDYSAGKFSRKPGISSLNVKKRQKKKLSDENSFLKVLLWIHRMHFQQPCRKVSPKSQLKVWCPKIMGIKKIFPSYFFFFWMFLWPRKCSDFARIVSVKNPKNCRSRSKIDLKIFKIQFQFSSKKSNGYGECSSCNTLQKSSPESRNSFAHCPKMTKKREFCRKSVSFPNLITDTESAILATSPGNFQGEAEFFWLNVLKLLKKNLI